jgi:hypothetical protein
MERPVQPFLFNARQDRQIAEMTGSCILAGMGSSNMPILFAPGIRQASRNFRSKTDARRHLHLLFRFMLSIAGARRRPAPVHPSNPTALSHRPDLMGGR